jgi:hypothetical protein
MFNLFKKKRLQEAEQILYRQVFIKNVRELANLDKRSLPLENFIFFSVSVWSRLFSGP